MRLNKLHHLLIGIALGIVVIVPIGAFADPTFPAPRISVWEERMHPWVGLPEDVEHVA